MHKHTVDQYTSSTFWLMIAWATVLRFFFSSGTTQEKMNIFFHKINCHSVIARHAKKNVWKNHNFFLFIQKKTFTTLEKKLKRKNVLNDKCIWYVTIMRYGWKKYFYKKWQRWGTQQCNIFLWTWIPLLRQPLFVCFL